MVEAPAHEPAVGDHRSGNGRRDLLRRRHLMAVRATGEQRRAQTAESRDLADGARARVAEEYPPLQLFTGRKLIAELSHLLLHEVVQLAPAGEALHARAVLGVLLGQTPQEIPDVIGITVWNAQVGVVRI